MCCYSSAVQWFGPVLRTFKRTQSQHGYGLHLGQCIGALMCRLSSLTVIFTQTLARSGALPTAHRSKDATVKFWDVSSGLCVNTIAAHMGEVRTHVCMLCSLAADSLALVSMLHDFVWKCWLGVWQRPIEIYMEVY